MTMVRGEPVPQLSDLSDVDVSVALAALTTSQRHGFLGPGELQPHLAHALAFADVVRWAAPVRGRSTDPFTPFTDRSGGDGRRVAVDMGTGGGLPGIVLALALPELSWVLLDSMERRTRVLSGIVDAAPALSSVQVVTERAEAWATTVGSGIASVTVARSFGPPALVAECASPMLEPDGLLIVSEPPGGHERWDGVEDAGLGFDPVLIVEARGAHFAVLRRACEIVVSLPRRPAAMARRPLF